MINHSLLCGIKTFCLTVILHCLTTIAFANPVIPVSVESKQPIYIPVPPVLQAKAYVLMDAVSGKVIAENNSRERLPPASLTKLMSMYIISDALKNGHIKRDDKVLISSKAWKMEGSRMFVKAGDEVPLKDLLLGIIVASGNDATVAVSEHVAGTEEAFTDLMNQEAKILGMNDSHFTDSTGLPDPNHYTSAYDLALLSQAYIKNFPEEYVHNSEKWFAYNGIKQPNRNRLLWRYKFADGLKTGHTNDAGYCLVASAKKDGMRLISVVLGEPNDAARTEDSIRLLNYGFRFYETRKLYNGNKPIINARIYKGEKVEIPMGVESDLYATIPAGQYKKLIASMTLKNPLVAPIVKGESYGTLKVLYHNQVITSQKLIALEDSTRGNMWRRTSDALRLKIKKYFSKPEDKANTQ